MPPLEEQFAGVSLEGGGDFTKQLACYALSKGISIPVYKVIPQMCLGEPRTYSCAVKVGTELRVWLRTVVKMLYSISATKILLYNSIHLW